MKQKKVTSLPKGKWTRMFLSLVLLMVFTTVMAFAQKPISGKVTDENGASIPGVSVVVKVQQLEQLPILTVNMNSKLQTITTKLYPFLL